MSSEFLCRLCLEDNDNLLNAFTEIGDDIKISDIILQHLQFDIKENDDISNKICLNCWNKLVDFHDFYISIQKAQDTITIIESKFTIDEKLNFKEIFIGDSILKFNNNNDGNNDNDDDSNIFKDDECHNVNDDNHRGISNLDIASNLNTENNGIVENVTTLIPNTNNIEDIITIKQEILNIDLQRIDNLNKSFDDSESFSIFHQKSSNKNDKGSIQNIFVENLDVKKEEPDKNSSKVTLKNNKKTSPSNKNENILNDEDRDLVSNSKDDVPKKKTKKSSVTRNVKKQKKTNVNKDNEEKRIESYYKMKCEICQDLNESFRTLFEHYMKSHGIRGFITCCEKKYFKRKAIAEHVLWHKEPDLFKCKTCNKIYADKKCLNNHLLVHAPPDMKLYKCDRCPESFAKKFKLDQHRVKHLKPEEKKYKCDDCMKPYATNTLLRAHRRLVHEKTYSHMCEICARVFNSRTFFEKHQLEHLGKKLPKIQCKVCEAWMKNEHTMRAHMRLHRDEGITHECDICGKQGPSRNSILKHKRFVHFSERKFKCTLCDKAFKRAITLKEHMSTHTGEILYTCTFCSKTFNSGANMHAHRKKAHPIEWEAEKRNKIESMKPST